MLPTPVGMNQRLAGRVEVERGTRLRSFWGTGGPVRSGLWLSMTQGRLPAAAVRTSHPGGALTYRYFRGQAEPIGLVDTYDHPIHAQGLQRRDRHCMCGGRSASESFPAHCIRDQLRATHVGRNTFKQLGFCPPVSGDSSKGHAVLSNG